MKNLNFILRLHTAFVKLGFIFFLRQFHIIISNHYNFIYKWDHCADIMTIYLDISHLLINVKLYHAGSFSEVEPDQTEV